MQKTAYVYVPTPSTTNLTVGLERGLWGWRSATLDRAESRRAVRSLSEGDLLVLGHRGPNSRVAPGGWDGAVLQRVIISEVSRPLFTADDEVWTDDDYPERIGMDVLEDVSPSEGVTLGSGAMEALRLSANKQGAAVLEPGVLEVTRFVESLPPVISGSDTGSISHDGETSTATTVLRRREQAKMRRARFGNATRLTCAICGRVLPSRFVRAAHIKRRSAASRVERLTLANIIPACLMGCDELFEHGHIYVDHTGTIKAGPKAEETADLAAVAARLAGQPVSGLTGEQEPFFSWHRRHVAQQS
ncbi:hypothetical protein [Streptomyces sp. NPDC048357]|uniref:hypothetical protein n=1 Tax=Streptomyces sp. NPDC048357 TaxID=3154719 RepID=UPI00344028F7